MKTLKYLLSVIVLLTGVLFSCTEEWDSHYSKQEEVVNNENIEIVDESIVTYIKSQSSYSSANKFFEETGVFTSMTEKNLFYAIFVVDNDGMPTFTENDDLAYLASSHISTISLSPGNIKDGQRIVMWNTKYVNVTKMPVDDGHLITFNGSRVKRVIKANNGYIYELEGLIQSPRSLMEVLESLNDNYSIFKDMVLSKNEKTFDKDASVPIGVDASGNTIYDSIFTVKNPYFESKGVKLFDESSSITMLIPSNEQITNAMSEGKAKLSSWNIARQDSILENWCFQSAFFTKKYTREAFEDTQNIDLTSAFGKQWRTTVNKVDLDNPIEMSNGIAYYMTSFKIPQNVLIYRFKDYMKWYQYLSAEDKAQYFVLSNLTYNRTSTEVAAWSPGQGWPAIDNTAVWFYQATKDEECVIDFTAFRFTKYEDNSYDLDPYLLPPGEYLLSVGFSSRQTGSYMDISFNGELIKTINPTGFASYSRDRNGGLQPEFYPSTLHKNYDLDGGGVGIITVTGDQPVPIRITYRTYDFLTGTTTYLHHWCVRPTANCY